jgi:hypothetical protein
MQFEKSADTKLLHAFLSELEIGQTATYDEMSKIIGRDVRVFAISSLRSARNLLLREKGMVFGVETNVGLVRLNDSEIVSSVEADRKKVHRASAKVIRKLGCVKFDSLDDTQKKVHVTMSAQFGVLAMMSQKSSTKKIEESVKSSDATLAIGNTLKLFS